MNKMATKQCKQHYSYSQYLKAKLTNMRKRK